MVKVECVTEARYFQGTKIDFCVIPCPYKDGIKVGSHSCRSCEKNFGFTDGKIRIMCSGDED